MSEVLVFPVKPRDWVANRGDPSRVAQVKDVWADGGEILVDLVLYSLKGEKIGRESPACGGPRTFEPSCDFSGWYRIDAPNFPLQIRWVTDHDYAGHVVRIARYDPGPMLPNRHWMKPVRRTPRLLPGMQTNNVEVEIAALRRSAQEIRDLARKYPEIPDFVARAVELEKEANALAKANEA